MKKTILFPVIALALAASACNTSTKNEEGETAGTENVQSADSTASHALDTTTLAKGTVFYQCSMHPEVIGDKPGNCSKCGMDLVKVEKN